MATQIADLLCHDQQRKPSSGIALASVQLPSSGLRAFAADSRCRAASRLRRALRRLWEHPRLRSRAWASEADALGNVTTFSRTATTSTVTDALGRSTTPESTPLGLPLSTTYPDGSTTSATFFGTTHLEEATDTPLSYTDETGRVRSYTYGPQAELVTATDLGGNVWTYGEPTDDAYSVTSPMGETLTVVSDESMNPSSITYPDGGVASMLYEEFVRLSQLTQPDGTVVNYVYDALDRLTSRSTSTGELETTTYDTLGRVDTIVDGTGTTAMAYDSAGRFAGFESGAGASIEYVRDAGGVTEVRTKASPVATAEVTVYAYNAVGSIASITDPLGGVTSFVYDAVHRKSSRTLPNGVVTSYGYDLRDRIVSIEHRDASTAVLASYTYTRTVSGEPSRITREDGSYTEYSYNGSLAIVAERVFSVADVLQSEIVYTYDADGNRTSKTTGAGTDAYAYAAGFQLTSAGADTFSHDANGRIDSMTRGGATTALTYSSTDHVTSVTTGAAVSSYEYDAAGRRVAVTDAAGSRDYLVAPSIGDGLDSPHLVLDGTTGAPIANYVYGGEHAYMRITGGSAEYYLEDAMGSVIGVANAAGALSQSIEYDSFGNVLNGAALPSDTAGEFRFHGMWLEPTGLYHVRARHYDATTGRFVSRDAAEGNELNPESWQPYLFAKNNGLVWRDPTGRTSLQSLSISQVVGRVLQSLPRVFGAAVTGEVRNRVLGFVGRVVLNHLVPGIGISLGLNLSIEQDSFENFVEKQACEALGAVSDTAATLLYIEVPLDGTGKPLGSAGADCSKYLQQQKPVQETWNERSGQPVAAPDLLLSSNTPREIAKEGKKSWGIAEIKFKLTHKNKAPDKIERTEKQFQHSVAHAKNHSYSRTVLYLVGRSPKKEFKSRWKAAAARQGVLLLMPKFL